MSTQHADHLPLKPGRDSEGIGASHILHVNDAEEQFSRHSARILSGLEGKALSVGWGGPLGDSTGRFTATNDNSATQAWTDGGLRFQLQAAPSDGDDVGRNTLECQTLAVGKRYKCSTRVQVSSAANLGFSFGFATKATAEVNSANPADGVFFIKTKSSSALVARVVANSATAVDISGTNFISDANKTLAAPVFADAIDIQLGIEFEIGATAAATFGWWIVNGFKTPFSAAQITALFDMYNTTAAVLCGVYGFRVNSTTQRNGVSSFAWWEIDR